MNSDQLSLLLSLGLFALLFLGLGFLWGSWLEYRRSRESLGVLNRELDRLAEREERRRRLFEEMQGSYRKLVDRVKRGVAVIQGEDDDSGPD